MSLYRRNEVYWSKIMHNGALTRRSLGVKNKTDARALEAAFRLQIARDEMGVREVPTLAAYIPVFLNYIPSRVTPNTFKAYNNAAQHLLKYPPLANCLINQIDGAKIAAYATHRRNTKTRRGAVTAVCSVNLTLRVLSRILHMAQEEKIITWVPRTHCLSGEGRREHVISDTAEKALIEASLPWMKRLIPFLIDTGLRISEAANLHWSDVTETSITVKEGKSKAARRTIPLTTRAQAILVELRVEGANAAYVLTRKGKKLSPTLITGDFLSARRELGLPDGLCLHSTRHTFCTRLGKAGASAYELQKLAGHSNIQISSRYCHPDTEQLSRAIDRLNK